MNLAENQGVHGICCVVEFAFIKLDGRVGLQTRGQMILIL